MRKFITYIALIMTVVVSCKEMDSEYQDYVVENGLTYPQKADSLKALAGFNRLKLTWLKPKFPGVKYSVVYWNNYADSLKVEFTDDQDMISAEIDNLEEMSYSFVVRNYDQNGEISIPAEVTGAPYGENYLIGAVDRVFTSAVRDDENSGTIQWDPATTDLVYTEVRYKSTSGVEKTVRISPADEALICSEIQPGQAFEYRSVFLPANGIDSVAREWQTSETPFLYNYPRGTWTVEARNGHHDWSDAGGGEPELVLDGDINTGWHSTPGTPLPQCFVVDMQESLTVDQLVLSLPAPTNWRYIQNADVYLSDEPIVPDVPQEFWGVPVSSAQYVDGERFSISLETAQRGRYVAIVFPDSKAETYISFMELEVYGY